MSPKSLLIVDDEEAISWSLRKAFERAGYKVSVAASAESAFELAGELAFDAVILDVHLPGMDGITALGKLRKLTREAPVIVITAHGNLSTTVKAVEGGAFEYLPKPFNLSQALDAVARAVKTRPAHDEKPLGESEDEDIIGRSLPMQAVFKRIALVAPHDACVLIAGESGTGKELVARALHRHSLRRDKPFIPVHVAALNPNLVESELFGHVKGAFTGASQSKPGLLVLADGGTVFLDELADIPLPVQAKLLRVVEHQEVMPVGSNEMIRISVRILSATHQDLSKAVRLAQFRHDLYFRLNVFEIQVPALRDRTDDIPLLAEHFLRRFGGKSVSVSPETIAFLQARPWAGNVRELRNALEHAAIIARGGALLPEHFPPPASTAGAETLPMRIGALIHEWVRERIQSAADTEPANLYDELLKCVEPPLLDEVLRQLDGNRLAAARWLGLARATLRKMIQAYRPPDEAGDEADA
jgi:two-component system, NtrC family, nitrogen regulation response regulator GlnG